MLNIDDRTAYENNQIEFWSCDCVKEPKYMYCVDGEYGATLMDFWKNYNCFPLKVVHNFIEEADDVYDDNKMYKYRVDEVHSIHELENILDNVGWKLTFENFFITNSSKEIKFNILTENTLKGKVSVQHPVFELGPADTLTEVILHGSSFLVGTNNNNLSAKEKIKEIILS
ncbi:hypothetical protein [Pseudobacillus badius]|uniref:hypothetical protein n=1 Tax=Bacillus badius TaxID=1455 RepID=UPI003D348B14